MGGDWADLPETIYSASTSACYGTNLRTPRAEGFKYLYSTIFSILATLVNQIFGQFVFITNTLKRYQIGTITLRNTYIHIINL